MIKTEDEFIERLVSVADNFDWRISGTQIYGFRKNNLYDPLTAYVLIKKGFFVPRHKVEEYVPKMAEMPPTLFRTFMKALYSNDYSDPSIGKLRDKILKAVGLP